MKKAKRAAALIGAALLLGMYVITFIFGVTGRENAADLLMASIICTVLVPVVLYGMMIVANMARPKPGEYLPDGSEIQDKAESGLPDTDTLKQ